MDISQKEAGHTFKNLASLLKEKDKHVKMALALVDQIETTQKVKKEITKNILKYDNLIVDYIDRMHKELFNGKTD